MSSIDYQKFSSETAPGLKNGMRIVDQSINQPIVIKESGAAVLFRTLLSGAGFVADAYDLFVMNVVLVVLGCEFQDPDSKSMCSLETEYKSMLATAVLVGSIIGQLVFGVLADYIGRRKGFIATLSLLIIGAALSAGSVGSTTAGLFGMLAASRAILGIGVGGEYPLASTVASEASVSSAGRGKRVSLVFSMQGVGLILAPSVVTLLLVITGDMDLVWRLALAFGGLPGVCMLYFRFKMKETPVFAAAQSNSRDSEEKWADLRAHWKDLLATTVSWFLFDVIFYANSLFSSEITKHFIPVGDDPREYAKAVGVSTLILAACALPGYWVSVLVIDRIGRRPLQLIGFVGMSISYVICGSTIPVLQRHEGLFYFVYGLSFFFCNCGPNVTTFVIPSEVFPTSIRASAHGISAACGKAGAALGTALMPLLLQHSSLAGVMYVSAGLSAVGAIFTFFMTRETQYISSVIDGEEEHQQRAIVVEEGDESFDDQHMDEPFE